MYKDKAKQQEANREKARRHRERVKGVTQSDSNPQEIVTPSVTPRIPETAKKYPALVYALCDPQKRFKLERINAELQRKGLGSGVTLGWYGPDFNIIDGCLKATS